MRNGLCLLVLAMVATPVGAQTLTMAPLWRHVVGVHAPMDTPHVLADLDGDGIDDIAVMTRQSTPYFETNGIAVVGKASDQSWRWKDVLHASNRLVSPMLALPHPDGDQLVVLRGRVLPEGWEHLELVRYAGIPLREVGAVDVGALEVVTLQALGDVDGDGSVDVVEAVGPSFPEPARVRVRDIASGALRWSQGVNGATVVTLAQLDGDAALELIVGGATGRVLDGAFGLQEWAYAGGFPAPVVSGNFDADGTDTEFASLAMSSAVLFQSGPYSPVRDFELPCCTDTVAAGDVDADGIDEWLVASGAGYLVDPLDESVTVLPSGASNPTQVGIGDVDGVPGPELILDSVGWGQSRMRVLDALGFDPIFETTSLSTATLPVLVADLDGDGSERVALVASSGEDTVLHILDAATGALLRSAPLPELAGHYSGARLLQVAAGQLDDDAALEIAVGRNTTWNDHVVVLDAVDFTRMYTLGETVLPSGASRLFVADVDADGNGELVALGADLRARLFDGATGTPLWTSIAVWGWGGEGMAVRNVDDDPALEILVGNGRDVYAYDGATHLLDWSIGSLVTDRRFVVFDRDDVCRIAMYGEYGYQEFPCGAGEPGPFVQATPRLGAVLPVPLGDAAMLAISEGHVVRFDIGEDIAQRLSPAVGTTAGMRDGSVAVFGEGRVLVGSDGVVTALQLVVADVFADGFE